MRNFIQLLPLPFYPTHPCTKTQCSPSGCCLHQLRFATHSLQSRVRENSGIWVSSTGPHIPPRAGHRTLAVAGVPTSFPDPKHSIANATAIQPHSNPAACLSILTGEVQPSGCHCSAECPPFRLGTIWTSHVCAGPGRGHHDTERVNLQRDTSSAFSLPALLAH